jgi:LysM repeat protein
VSEAPPETRAPSRSSSGGGNVLTHRLGPLPTWVWIAIAAALIISYSWWKSKSANAASSANTAASSTPADQVPQFVNQTYTTVTPPSVNVTDNDTSAPAGGAPPAPTPVKTTPTPVKAPAPKPVAPKPAQPPIFNKTYVVKKGETLNSVAKSLGISRVDLAHANGLGTGAGLRTGQTLKVPSPAPGGTPNKAQ